MSNTFLKDISNIDILLNESVSSHDFKIFLILNRIPYHYEKFLNDYFMEYPNKLIKKFMDEILKMVSWNI